MMDKRLVTDYESEKTSNSANGEDSVQIWTITENILNKQQRTADKVWSSGLEIGRRADR
jgi:hypothetical protein